MSTIAPIWSHVSVDGSKDPISLAEERLRLEIARTIEHERKVASAHLENCLERLREEHVSEVLELQKSHANELRLVRKSFDALEQTVESRAKIIALAILPGLVRELTTESDLEERVLSAIEQAGDAASLTLLLPRDGAEFVEPYMPPHVEVRESAELSWGDFLLASADRLLDARIRSIISEINPDDLF